MRLRRPSSFLGLCFSVVSLFRLGGSWLRILLACSEVGPGGSLARYFVILRVIPEDVPCPSRFDRSRRSREYCADLVIAHIAKEMIAKASRPECDLVHCCWKHRLYSLGPMQRFCPLSWLFARISLSEVASDKSSELSAHQISFKNSLGLFLRAERSSNPCPKSPRTLSSHQVSR